MSRPYFIADSYGFRPARSCHHALRALSETVEDKPVNHIVEADIKGFFDNVNQEWLLKFPSTVRALASTGDALNFLIFVAYPLKLT